MYFCLYLVVITIIVNCLYTIVLTRSSTNNDSNRIDPIVRNIKHIVDEALQDDTSNDIDNEFLIEQLSRILEQEEGFRLDDRKQRSIYSTNNDEIGIFDGSGDLESEELPPVYSNMSIVAFTMGTTTTAFAKYTPRTYSPCRCEKGERGEKGDAGICPADCTVKYNTETKDCLGSQINIQHLAQSIRQLIVDSKKIAYRNARAVPCVCTPSPLSSTTVSSISTPFTLDYNTYMRLKGDKGDIGTSCSPTCTQSIQTNVRVFKTLQQALDTSSTYPDHTYIHIVNDYGRLQGVYIRVHGQLIPLRLESDSSYYVQVQTLPPTTLSNPKPRCTTTLPCKSLHIFAVGPRVRKMCYPERTDLLCSKLSDYDDLCDHISQSQGLTGFYRAFMSTRTQWLSNLFTGICVSATIVNMHEKILFDTIEDIFQQKPPQNEILDVQGLKPQFQYWWHGTYVNGTASSDTCHDWSRQDSSLSGIASRIPDGKHGLFHQQYTWPCSISDTNMGIFCIETNCQRINYH
ncbi:unnamed protein product [Rotaria sordida]|uniref:Collagenase NC10/endostatin domain-containing protein n=2 Tax=Rotaria sordida TaxID=392033 RepID=A0A819CRP4_9BILA|nr:unnamed protein product [Rotaria sordida]CAF3711767.1 unnamed protein product [Rotaria sordida]CAF3773919.1 unnamed protein product [Rotaria sordida]CAF3816468.1 unnamed protein product [Rotaria sordida]